MDLMQEHNIKQLKKLLERRDATFAGEFFQDVVAMNIRALLKANETVRAAVRLGGQGSSHKRKKKIAAEQRLSATMNECELHKFRSGRTLAHRAQDDFDEGYVMLGEGRKVKEFIKRTLVDAGAIYDDMESDEAQGSDDRPSPPLPNMLVNGILVSGEEHDNDADLSLFNNDSSDEDVEDD